MKWDKKNKDRLYRAIWERFQTIKSSGDNIWTDRHLRDKFLIEFGILKVHKPKGSRLWHLTTNPARNKDRIVIGDPWWSPSGDCPPARRYSKKNPFYTARDIEGLSIPKDIAEKFLMLGVP